MNYTFADRISALKPSAIREILKFTSLPGVISFAAGNPSSEAIPSEEIAQLISQILSELPSAALQYSVSEGYTPLRDLLSDYLLKNKNIGQSFDRMLITSGAQQAVELTAKALCNEGDTVVCENPSFIGSLNAFRSYRLKLAGVPATGEGMDLDALEEVLISEKNVRFIYTIPNFQNPTGAVMPLDNRKKLYALAVKYNVLILEDNPYEETRFSGETIPSVKSLDTEGRVIYAGSFSKILSPGLRVGYACAPSEIIQKMVVCKQVSDVHTNILAQMVAERFMAGESFAPHLAKIKSIYKRKAELMMSLCQEKLSAQIRVNPVEGGLFLWCTLPKGADMNAFCIEAVEKKVAVVPGNAFLTDETAPCASFRINFSTPSDEEIIKGMNILGETSRSFIEKI